MTDSEFLGWVHARLECKGDDKNSDFMIRLKEMEESVRRQEMNLKYGESKVKRLMDGNETSAFDKDTSVDLLTEIRNALYDIRDK